MGTISSSPTQETLRDIKICTYLHGLYGSGKQSFFEKFREVADGFGGIIFGEHREIEMKYISYELPGIGGRGLQRPVASHVYKEGVDIMLIVVDCLPHYTHDISYLLKDLLQEGSLKDAIFLVLTNNDTQDLDETCSVKQVAEELDFHDVTRSHVANIMGCSAKTGEGLQEAIDWLTTSLEAQKERVPVEITAKKHAKTSRSMISRVRGGFQAPKSTVKGFG